MYCKNCGKTIVDFSDPEDQGPEWLHMPGAYWYCHYGESATHAEPK